MKAWDVAQEMMINNELIDNRTKEQKNLDKYIDYTNITEKLIDAYESGVNSISYGHLIQMHAECKEMKWNKLKEYCEVLLGAKDYLNELKDFNLDDLALEDI